MIEQNKKAQSMLEGAINQINRDRIVRKVEKCRDYQQEVKIRLREKKHREETIIEKNLEYMATMLPSALEMHKFIKIMTKDPIFENEKSYKIASQIHKFKDKERLDYLLNNNLTNQ